MRKIEVSCDVPGCGVTALQDERAGALEGWLRREVKDGVKREMAEGMRDFTARVVLHICPAHLEDAEQVPSPGTHPEVLGFLAQPDALDGTGTGPDPDTLPSESVELHFTEGEPIPETE